MDSVQGMRVFVRVAQLSGFSAAARELEMSAAAVTKHIAALEDRVGVRLLERTTRRVHLTEGGRLYLERCIECLQAFDDADAAVSHHTRSPSGVLRVTAPGELLGHVHVSRVVTAYKRACPQVRVDLHLSNRSLDLIEEGFDVGIDILHTKSSSYVARPLFTSRMGVWGAPSYFRTHGRPRTPADLVKHPHLVFSEPRPRTELVFRKQKRVVTVKLEPAIVSNSGAALLTPLVEGVGLIAAPSFLIAEHYAAGRIEPVLLDWSLEPLKFHVIYPTRRFLPAKVRAFLEALRDYFGDDPNADIWWSRDRTQS